MTMHADWPAFAPLWLDMPYYEMVPGAGAMAGFVLMSPLLPKSNKKNHPRWHILIMLVCKNVNK
jgi:hypothetical protein